MTSPKPWARGLLWLAALCCFPHAFAGEADINIPNLHDVAFNVLGSSVCGMTLLYAGLVICALGAAFGLVQYRQTKALPVHGRMRAVSNTIWETCKTYLLQQGKFLAVLWLLIAVCIIYYFVGLRWNDPELTHGQLISNGIVILICSVLGILGSYGVAWFGIRI